MKLNNPLRRIGNKVLGWCISHPVETIVSFGASVLALLSGGTALSVGASKKNEKAEQIYKESISKYNSYKENTDKSLELLGSLKMEVINSFDAFFDAMERIQGRPTGLGNKINKVTLPDVNLDELKVLKINTQQIITGVSGTTLGTLVGLAAFGLNPAVFAPAALFGSGAVCIKGVNLYKKAVKNLHQAKKIQQETEEIVSYLVAMKDASDKLYRTMSEVNSLYKVNLKKMVKAVGRKKKNWKQFSIEEQKNIKNTICLVNILSEMCKIGIITEQTVTEEKQRVNSQVISKVIVRAEGVLESLD